MTLTFQENSQVQTRIQRKKKNDDAQRLSVRTTIAFCLKMVGCTTWEGIKSRNNSKHTFSLRKKSNNITQSGMANLATIV